MVKAEKCSTHSDVLPLMEEISLTLTLIWKHLTAVGRETDSQMHLDDIIFRLNSISMKNNSNFGFQYL